MTQDHAAPVPGRVLKVVGTGTAAAPEPVPGDSIPVPESVPMTVLERCRRTAAHWAGTAAGGAAQLWLHPGRVLHVLWHGKPESMAEHRGYIKSRAWVPEELSGKPETVIALAGILYHLIIARPLKIAFRAGDAAAERPLRLFLLAASCFLLYLIVPHI